MRRASTASTASTASAATAAVTALLMAFSFCHMTAYNTILIHPQMQAVRYLIGYRVRFFHNGYQTPLFGTAFPGHDQNPDWAQKNQN